MKTLYSSVIEAREMGTGRRLCDLFMVKPSKKDYPDYYKIILEPMDLRIIDHNIRSDQYLSEDSMVEDLKLMFRNARHYNEEGSQVSGPIRTPDDVYVYFVSCDRGPHSILKDYNQQSLDLSAPVH